MSALDLIHGFGIRVDLSDNVIFAHESDVLFGCGRHVAAQALDDADMHFAGLGSDVEATHAMAIDPSYTHLAVAQLARVAAGAADEAVAFVPRVVVFDVQQPVLYRRVRVLPKPAVHGAAGVSSAPFTCVAFSGDGKYVAACSAAPECAACVWQWSTGRVVHTGGIGGPARRVSFNPADASQLCVSGPGGLFRLFRLLDETVQAFPPFSGVRADEDVTEHAWTADDRIAATTRRGALLLIDDCEVRQEFAPTRPAAGGDMAVAAAAMAAGMGESTWAVRAMGKILIVGGAAGRFDIYTRDEPLPGAAGAGGGGAGARAAAAVAATSMRAPYFLTRSLVVSMDGAPVTRVMGLSWSPSQEQLAVAVDGGVGIVNMPLLGLMDAAERAVTVVWVSRGGHTAPVSSLDVCCTKPLLTTCSAGDGTVKVWNYCTKRLEATWVEQDAAVRAAGAGTRYVSFHPAGHVVAGTAPGRVRIFSVLAGELTVQHEVVAHGATMARFSRGGGYIAAACAKVVVIYSMFGANGPEEFARLEGHVAPVVCLAWAEHDASLLTGGGDGAVYSWAASAMAGTAAGMVPREGEHVRKGTGVAAITAGAAGSVAVTLGAPRPYATATVALVAEDDAARARKRYTPAPGGGGGAAGGRTRTAGMSSAADAGGAGEGVAPLTLVAWAAGIAGDRCEPAEEVAPASRITTLQLARVRKAEVLWAGTAYGDVEERVFIANAFGAVAVGAAARALSELPAAAVSRVGLHAGAITDIVVSADRCFMFTSSEDGCVMMVAVQEEIEDMQHRRGAAASRRGTLVGAAEVTDATVDRASKLRSKLKAIELIAGSADPLVQLPETSLIEMRTSIARLQSELQEARKDFEFRFANAERLNAEARLREVNEIREVKDEAIALQGVHLDEANRVRRQLDEKLLAQERAHMGAAEQLERLYEARRQKDTERMKELEEALDDIRAATEAHTAESEAVAKASQSHMLTQFQARVAELTKAHADVQAYAEYIKTEYERQLDEQEARHDAEVIELKAKVALATDRLAAETQRCSGEAASLRRHITTLHGKLDDAGIRYESLEGDRQREVAARADIAEHMRSMEADMASIRATLGERDAALRSADRHLKEVERSRGSLQRQVVEMRATIEPKDAEIASLGAQLKEIDGEFREHIKKMERQEVALATATRKVAQLKASLDESDAALRRTRVAVHTFSVALHEVVHDVPPKLWNAEILKLHDKFVSGKHPIDSDDKVAAASLAPTVEQAIVDSSITAEFQLQRKNMLRKLEGHKRHAEREELKVSEARRRAVAENGVLVDELNRLRVQNRELLAKFDALEAEQARAHAATIAAAAARTTVARGSSGSGSGAPSSARGGGGGAPTGRPGSASAARVGSGGGARPGAGAASSLARSATVPASSDREAAGLGVAALAARLGSEGGFKIVSYAGEQAASRSPSPPLPLGDRGASPSDGTGALRDDGRSGSGLGLSLAEAKSVMGALGELEGGGGTDAERDAVRAQVQDMLRMRSRRATPSRAGGFGARSLAPVRRDTRGLDAATNAVLLSTTSKAAATAAAADVGGDPAEVQRPWSPKSSLSGGGLASRSRPATPSGARDPGARPREASSKAPQDLVVGRQGVK